MFSLTNFDSRLIVAFLTKSSFEQTCTFRPFPPSPYPLSTGECRPPDTRHRIGHKMSVASATCADGDGHSIDIPDATGGDDSLNSMTNVLMSNAGPSAESKLVIQHYESESKSVGEILDNITASMVKFRPVHRWDVKLFVPPVKQLSAAVRKYIISERPNVDFLLAYSSVEEIISCEDVHKVSRAMAHPGDISRNLFCTVLATLNLSIIQDALGIINSEANMVDSSNRTADSSAAATNPPMQARVAIGRIV